MAFCSECGTKLDNNDRFCFKCGAVVEIDPADWEPLRNPAQRTQEFAGKVIKCPHCGETLGSFVTFCPSCGCEIRGAANSSAVEDFSRQIMTAYNEKEKIAIIRNFPIPNTKEDILEFAILASTNINENLNLDDEVSDAWFAKLGQADQKAQMTFPDEPEYARVRQLYNRVKEARTQSKQASNLKKKEKEYESEKQEYKSVVREDVSSAKGYAVPKILVAIGWFIAVLIIIAFCTDGALTPKLILVLVLVLGIFIIPLVSGYRSAAPRIITVIGMIFNLLAMFAVAADDVNNIWLLVVYIICIAITLVRMFRYRIR